ncbi:glutathione S-transferase C-terminal domain-containing protein isoform X2 [Aquarana catesbeiana]|uniref:glutathione S-transferase C-terminal domain-containing protein isoform X2 n=1 Tax=Aquarana catesbeiana TaxID=8400 RepID=UPI003CC937F3
MKDISREDDMEEQLFLDFGIHHEGTILPLHTSITLFLMSYCNCKALKTKAVVSESERQVTLSTLSLPMDIAVVSKQDPPLIVRSCHLPAIVDASGMFCRAGLAVVLRHIIHKTYLADPTRKDVIELLGFKKTCLKACAEVSQWTRLCEISIPLAVEKFLQEPCAEIPPEILQLEKKLGEPVKVHNDDKLRRQKMQQEIKTNDNADGLGRKQELSQKKSQKTSSLELATALSKLSAQETVSRVAREPSNIRKAKNADLPPLEHVFAEGLYFTLTDVVLMPCIHQFLVALHKTSPEEISRIPLLAAWYERVQQVPGVQSAATACSITFLHFPDLNKTCDKHLQASETKTEEADSSEDQFLGGPRPTMTKLKENGIEAMFSFHPCPAPTIDWESLPAAVSPAQGNLPSDRAVRKQQQLNNLLSVVKNMAKPGDIIVDFCSGGVVLIENKEESLIRAKERSDGLGLSNIWFIQANLDYFIGAFNIGVALHACGVATDMVIEHCIAARAAFVICPCCYGFIQNTVKTTFPRSGRFQEVLSYKEHMMLCRFADQTAVQLPPERRLIGKRCMGLVDLDRAWAAEQCGYKAHVISMEPESCSPKNNLIVGFPV